MNKVTFSIIIPNYNSSNYILDTIESIMNQSYSEFELLIIDDSSSDNSIELIKSNYTDGRIKIFQNTENFGPNYSRNIGIQQSKGSHIIFVDSDDILNKDALKILTERDLYNFDFIYFGFVFESKKNTIIGQVPVPNLKLIGNDIIDSYYLGKISTVCWNKVYRSEFLKFNHVEFIPDLNHGRDSIFILECCLKARNVLCISDMLYISTVRDDSFSRKFSLSNVRSIKNNLERVVEKSIKENISSNLIKFYLAKHIRYILLVGSFRLSFLDFLKSIYLFRRSPSVILLFHPFVLRKSSIIKNIVSILILFPFVFYPITWALNKIKINPY
jgi:glycosyltransferase involved in cell wall biosynthesis